MQSRFHSEKSLIYQTLWNSFHRFSKYDQTNRLRGNHSAKLTQIRSKGYQT